MKAGVVENVMQESHGTMFHQANAFEVKRGEQIKFVITKSGLFAHEFILANTADNLKPAAFMSKYPDVEHDDPNGAAIQPGAKGDMLSHFASLPERSPPSTGRSKSSTWTRG